MFFQWLTSDGVIRWQALFSWLEILITVATLVFSIFSAINSRHLKKKLFSGETASLPKRQRTEAAVIVCIAPTDEDRDSMLAQVRRSIQNDRNLAREIIRRPALENSGDLGFGRPGDRFTVKPCFTDQEGTKGRIVVLSGRMMPEDPQGAKAYTEEFISCFNLMKARLKQRGVGNIHLFYRGPAPLAALIGAMARNHVGIDFYHYVGGTTYIKLANSAQAEFTPPLNRQA